MCVWEKGSVWVGEGMSVFWRRDECLWGRRDECVCVGETEREGDMEGGVCCNHTKTVIVIIVIIVSATEPTTRVRGRVGADEKEDHGRKWDMCAGDGR